MSGLLIIAVIVIAIVLALEPAHRRRTRLDPSPGVDTVHDRDRSRALSEIRAAEQRETRPQRLARMLGRAGSAVPMHRSRPVGSSTVPRILS